MVGDNGSGRTGRESSLAPGRLWKFMVVAVVFSLLGAGLLTYLIGVLRRPAGDDLFREYILDPIPGSVTDIKVDQPKTHGGYGYVFRFALNRADLELIRQSGPLRETEDIISDDTGLLWTWKDWESTETSGERAVAFSMYALAPSPSWYDLSAWENPEAYALRQEDKEENTDIQVLLYNDELGQAYFITFHYDGRGF